MIDEAWRIFSSTNEWVRYADAKAGAALAGAGVLAGALASAALSENFAHVTGIAFWLGAVAGGLAVVSALFATLAIIPKLKMGEPTSLIYFTHVAQRYRKIPKHLIEQKPASARHNEDLQSMLTQPEAYLDDVLAQVWANSNVAHKKFFWTGWSVRCLGLGVVLAGLAAVISIF